MSIEEIDLASISWIDRKGLPRVGFWFVAGASMSWYRRVIMGLVGTANPEPPESLANVQAFQRKQQYRALLSCTFSGGLRPRIAAQQIDPGFTPPFDKSTIPALERPFAPVPDDKTFYAGESSPVSGVVVGRLHPCSTLSIPGGSKVLLSALIKFRAGEHTDAIGISTDVASPVHVPWVWCEYALVSTGSRQSLICNGSVFPSHAWYINGRQVGKRLQTEVHASSTDPVLNTGQPAGKLRDRTEADKGSGAVSSQLYAVDAGLQQSIDLASLLK
jgi:hypothetical protein